MKKYNKIFFALFCLVLFFSTSSKALAATDCLCSTDLDNVSDSKLYKNQKTVLKAQCVDATEPNCKIDKQTKLTAKKLVPICAKIETADACADKAKEWGIKFDSMLASGKTAADTAAAETPANKSVLSTLINSCGQQDMAAECFDITVFISLMLQLTNYLFGIIGALALGAFVYGGFNLILSQGNPEKIKVGTGAMINAVIGLLIAFGGYVIVSYLGEILKLRSEFGLLK